MNAINVVKRWKSDCECCSLSIFWLRYNSDDIKILIIMTKLSEYIRNMNSSFYFKFFSLLKMIHRRRRNTQWKSRLNAYGRDMIKERLMRHERWFKSNKRQFSIQFLKYAKCAPIKLYFQQIASSFNLLTYFQPVVNGNCY